MNLLSGKILIPFGVIIGTGYLVSKFPDESVLIGGIAMIIIIGLWIFQAQEERNK